MNEMIERVAKAILDDTPPWLGLVHDWDTDEVRLQTVREFVGGTYMQGSTEQIALCAARAAIKAMRIPTDAMAQAGNTEKIQIDMRDGTTFGVPGLGNSPSAVWGRMIGAALSDAA